MFTNLLPSSPDKTTKASFTGFPLASFSVTESWPSDALLSSSLLSEQAHVNTK